MAKTAKEINKQIADLQRQKQANYQDNMFDSGYQKSIDSKIAALQTQKQTATANEAAKQAEASRGAFEIENADQMARQAQEQQKVQEARQKEAEAQQTQARTQQQAFISQLQEQAAGQGTSASQIALQKANERQQAQQRAVQASQAGSTAAGARSAARAQAANQAQMAQQSQGLRVQEQLQARQQLANALQQQRGQDVGMQQFQAGQASSLLGQQLAVEQARQGAAAAGQTLDVEQKLAAQGARLTKDIANIQAQQARSKGIGTAAGAAGGYLLGNYLLPGVGGQIGAAAGGTLGGMLTYNKGGKVESSKNSKPNMPSNMSKDASYGFQKALESNTNTDNNYAEGGQVRYTGDLPPQLSAEAQKQKARNIQDISKVKSKTKESTKAAEKKEAKAAGQAQESREAQSNLAAQLQQQAAGQGPSLADVKLKAQSDSSLAQQLAGAQAGKKAVDPARLQSALAATQQQQAAAIANQASQLAAQEAAQAQQLGTQVAGQLRAGDIASEQFAQQLANQQLMQEMAVRQAQQQAAQQQQSLAVDELAAIKAAEAQRKAASAGGGKFLGIFNAGGVVEGKEVVNGDSEKNDIVPALLSAGEVVIPKTVVEKGEEAMIGFIKGIEAMTSEKSKTKNPVKKSSGGKAKKYNKGGKTGPGGMTQQEQEGATPFTAGLQGDSEPTQGTEKETPGFFDDPKNAQMAASALKSGFGIIGQMEKQKRAIRDREMQQAAQDFRSALARIKGRRNYAKGGKVAPSGTYGSLLEAKKDLDKKLKELDNKKTKKD